MSISRWNGGWLGAARAAAIAGLVGAGVVPGPAQARAAEQVAQRAASPRRESPYARYAREHAKAEENKPLRVKITRSSQGRGMRGSGRAGRH